MDTGGKVYQAGGWIQMTMAALSILGSGSVICLLIQTLCRSPELQPLFLLSVSDLLLAVCWLIGAVLFLQPCGGHSSPCYNLHIIAQVLFMASFFYTLNYIWNLYQTVIDKFSSCLDGYPAQVSNRVNTAAKVRAVLSGLIPLLFMTPVFIMGNISKCQANFTEPYRCLLMNTGSLHHMSEHHQPTCRRLHHYHTAVFLFTFLLTLVTITALMVRSRCIFRRVITSNGYLGNEQRTSFRLMDRRMLLYPLVFFLCWGPAVILAFLRLVVPTAAMGRVGVVFYLLQDISLASQGFFNCLVYGWIRLNLRRAGSNFLPRDMDTQTPLLRQQKKNRGYQTLRTVA
ncbi:transmembrane protein 116 isoform 3-T4 [Pholidichthys leucotaenia]